MPSAFITGPMTGTSKISFLPRKRPVRPDRRIATTMAVKSK